jgi:hypothetical protein
MVEEDMDSLERRQDMAHLEHQEDMANLEQQEDMVSLIYREDTVSLIYREDMASLIYREDSFLDLVAALDKGVVLVDTSAGEAVAGGDDAGVLIEPARKEANLT